MKSRRVHFLAIAACMAFFAAAVPARAGIVPAQPRGATTFTFAIPGQEFFDGGFLFVDGFGPEVGTIITNTTVHIMYVSDGATPASDIDIHIALGVNDTFQETVITGADLGFVSGAGTFVGSISTADLNGVASSFFAPTSALSLQIGSIYDPPLIDGSGYFVNSTIVFDVIPVPEPGTIALLAVAALLVRRRARTAS